MAGGGERCSDDGRNNSKDFGGFATAAGWILYDKDDGVGGRKHKTWKMRKSFQSKFGKVSIALWAVASVNTGAQHKFGKYWSLAEIQFYACVFVCAPSPVSKIFYRKVNAEHKTLLTRNFLLHSFAYQKRKRKNAFHYASFLFPSFPSTPPPPSHHIQRFGGLAIRKTTNLVFKYQNHLKKSKTTPSYICVSTSLSFVYHPILYHIL